MMAALLDVSLAEFQNLSGKCIRTLSPEGLLAIHRAIQGRRPDFAAESLVHLSKTCTLPCISEFAELAEIGGLTRAMEVALHFRNYAAVRRLLRTANPLPAAACKMMLDLAITNRTIELVPLFLLSKRVSVTVDEPVVAIRARSEIWAVSLLADRRVIIHEVVLPNIQQYSLPVMPVAHLDFLTHPGVGCGGPFTQIADMKAGGVVRRLEPADRLGAFLRLTLQSAAIMTGNAEMARRLRGDPNAFHFAWLAAAFNRGTLPSVLLEDQGLSVYQMNALAVQALQHQNFWLLRCLWRGALKASPGGTLLSKAFGQLLALPHLPTNMDELCANVARGYEEANYDALAILVRFWVRCMVAIGTLPVRGYRLPDTVCGEIMRHVWADSSQYGLSMLEAAQ